MIAVVKVQTALYPTGAPGLIYDKDRQHQELVDLPSHVLDQMRGDPKAYFEAEWSGEGWLIGARVPAQEW